MFQILDGQIWWDQKRQGGGYKNGYILETIVLIELNLGQDIPQGVLYL